ncbi:MAG: carboxylesterase family protein [Pseudomonadota bacterium]
MTTITISTGSLKGCFDNGIHAFKGIPYAEPVSGPARWLPPVPRKPWQGVRDAQHYGEICLQFGSKALREPVPTARRRYFDAIGSFASCTEGDDSLLLNVWSPTLDANARLPVMLYIHGGGLNSGAANTLYDGTSFARKGVVCVAIQYRLGPLGFLHGAGLFGNDLCADNRGFLDQLCALQWVQQNIAQFGGDPACVTVFGESAGAFSVYQLSASPLARGLFKRGIAMGGMPYTCAPANEHHALAVDALGDVGVKPGDEQALIALDHAALKRLQKAISKRAFGKDAAARYGLLGRERVAYMGAATGTAFLPQAPMPGYGQGTPNDIDLMLGTCADDGRLFSLTLPFARSLSVKLWLKLLQGLMPNADVAALQTRYRQQMRGASTGRINEQINNDVFFRMPTIAAAEAHAAGHAGRTYLYQVDYQSAIKSLGAIHGIEVALLFTHNSSARTLIADDTATAALSEMMLQAWTSFAKTGRPVAAGMDPWPAFETSIRATMVFDRKPRLEPDWGGALRQCWSQ